MFEGLYTALVTPFNRDGAVDYGRLTELVERQLAGGVDGLVPVGTTGESPTLGVDEHLKVIETVATIARDRAMVVAGTGANSTREAVELTRQAMALGVQGTLQVTPYYNKPNQEGLYRHFSEVADLGLPVVLYNVPGRSAREIAIDTAIRLSEHEHVVAIKEAGGSVDRVSHLVRRCDLEVLSGDDALAFPMMAVGAVGLISVASNVIPAQVSKMIHLILEGQWDEAADLHQTLHPLFSDLFVDTNPIPVKAALALMGQLEEVYRLPLCPLAEAEKAKLTATMTSIGLLEGDRA